MFVILDTSVLIAAFLNPDGLTARIVWASPMDRILLCTSHAILRELVAKLRSKGSPSATIQSFVSATCTSSREYMGRVFPQFPLSRSGPDSMIVILDPNEVRELALDLIKGQGFMYIDSRCRIASGSRMTR